MSKIPPDDFPEVLTMLYLRLNGFFATGLILHAAKKGLDRGDVDCLAVRHRHHDQSERGIGTDPFLQVGDCTELLICDVKSSSDSLSFNKPLRTDPSVSKDALRWAGLAPREALNEAAMKKVVALFQDEIDLTAATQGVQFDSVRVRALLSCPNCDCDSVASRWCLCGQGMIEYIDQCLNPRIRRDACSPRYAYGKWGGYFEPVVLFFKNLRTTASPDGNTLRKAVTGQ